MPSGRKKSAKSVDVAFETLKELLISYPVKTGKRVKESELAQPPGVSRAPLRELTCNQLETRLDIDRNLGHTRECGFAMLGQICGVT